MKWELQNPEFLLKYSDFDSLIVAGGASLMSILLVVTGEDDVTAIVGAGDRGIESRASPKIVFLVEV